MHYMSSLMIWRFHILLVSRCLMGEKSNGFYRIADSQRLQSSWDAIWAAPCS